MSALEKKLKEIHSDNQHAIPGTRETFDACDVCPRLLAALRKAIEHRDSFVDRTYFHRLDLSASEMEEREERDKNRCNAELLALLNGSGE